MSINGVSRFLHALRSWRQVRLRAAAQVWSPERLAPFAMIESSADDFKDMYKASCEEKE